MKKYEKMYDVFEAAKNCILLNFCLILGTLLGGVIFGLGPSLMSANQMLRHNYHPLANRDKTFKQFFSLYKQNFKKGNQLFMPILLIAVFFYIDLHLFAELKILSSLGLLTVMAILQIAVWLLFSTIIPMFTYYDMTIRQVYGKCLLYLMHNPLLAVSSILWALICKMIISFLPGGILFFVLALWLHGNAIIFYRGFDHNEELLQKESLAS